MTTHTGKHCQTSKPLHALRHRRHDGGGGGTLGAVHDNRQCRPCADVAFLERAVALERPAVVREGKRGRARCVPSFRHHLHDAALGVVHCAVQRQLACADTTIVHAETQMQARASALSRGVTRRWGGRREVFCAYSTILRVLFGLESLAQPSPSLALKEVQAFTEGVLTLGVGVLASRVAHGGGVSASRFALAGAAGLRAPHGSNYHPGQQQ